MMKISMAKVDKSKASTFGYKTMKGRKVWKLVDVLNSRATVGCRLSGGHRRNEFVEEIFNWVRFDVDKEGEAEELEQRLRGLYYIKKPSTSNHEYPYKWHYLVKVCGVSQDPYRYKYQARKMCEDLGIVMSDTRATEVVVQNLNPYKNGTAVSEARALSRVVRGRRYRLVDEESIPSNIAFVPTRKVTFRGVGGYDTKPMGAVKILETGSDGRVVRLSSKSVIEVGDGGGWVELGMLNVGLGETMGGLGCPVCNTEHSDGRGGAGYAFAFRNSYEDLEIKCTGSACRGVRYYMSRDALLRDKYGVIDLGKAMAYVANTGYIVSKGLYLWVSSSGRVRYFRRGDVGVFYNDVLKDTVKRGDQVSDKSMFVWEYEKIFLEQMLDVVNREHQCEELRVKADPFGENSVRFENGKTMIINTREIMPKAPDDMSEDAAVIRDYREHFPEFEDFLRMIVANRFGADRKRAFVWWKASSNFGKSMLMENILGGMGLVVGTKESEIKLAVKGNPSGLNPDHFTTAWILFIDEFKGAVAELKDITHSFPISAKGKLKTIVDVYSKICASAENVESLVGANGMERQFANRFSMWETSGDITKRALYAADQEHYKRVLRTYVYKLLCEEATRYIKLGREKASVEASKVAGDIIGRHAISDTGDIMDHVATMRELMREDALEALNGFADTPLTRLFELKNDELMLINLAKAKDYFVDNYFSRSEQAILTHKGAKELLLLSDRKVFKSGKVARSGYLF